MTLCAVTSVLGVPFMVLALVSHEALAALGLLVVPVLCNAAWYGPVYAAAQSIVRPRTRATAAAILLFIINLIGLGLGPLCVGALSDVLAASGLGSTEGLRWSLLGCSVVAFIAAGCFWRARIPLRGEVVS
ncbi:hypothetical protein [Pedomonas mirosovicensis]|uniref:hypothetical protein n=1 Tax=Pedomonas mirosovicensis TaxID=2908641 RepID=UPI00216821A1|nr:hypothetical protein [Pedomonas mirosovicensis]MCH8685602.1 hypothetical protein [Pedomonas mirosovicensis]